MPFNCEADSLDSMVLGPDAAPGTPEFDLFIKEMRREFTVKAASAALRFAGPWSRRPKAVADALRQQLDRVTVGDPALEQVHRALAGMEQRSEVEQAVSRLLTETEVMYAMESPELLVPMRRRRSTTHVLTLPAFAGQLVHEVEPFGPVSSLLPYRDLGEAIELVHKGKGSLCCSIATADRMVAREFVTEAATHHGRILVLDAECAKESTGHGSPMPQLVHGGPGRAGGGEEMGGLRGIGHYLQRTAIKDA